MSRDLIILISGTGSTMRAIALAAQQQAWSAPPPRGLDSQLRAVISNRPGVQGLLTAEGLGIPSQVVDHKVIDGLGPRPGQRQAPLIALAGFMRVLTPAFVARYAGRMVNIHPSLLPHFPGLHTHQRAMDAGHAHAGSSVHWVTAELDGGPLLGQTKVPILPGDTAETLGARVQAAERELYPRILAGLLA
jgi:phosphoribosylglycinamide formyltransferase-1